jgi:hypothetical protein
MSAFLVVDAVPDLEDGQLEGVARFSANLGLLPGLSGTIPDFATSLPSNVNGTWSLVLQPTILNNSVAGLAAITTSTGQSFGLVLSGPFRNGDFDVKLQGSRNLSGVTTSGVGSSAKALIDSTFDSILFDGKVMGQKLDFAFPSD